MVAAGATAAPFAEAAPAAGTNAVGTAGGGREVAVGWKRACVRMLEQRWAQEDLERKRERERRALERKQEEIERRERSLEHLGKWGG